MIFLMRFLNLLFFLSLYVTGHPRDTLHTSTCFHRLSNQRPITRLPQSTAIYGILPYSAYLFLPQYLRYPQRPWLLPNSAKFCQDYDPKPILPRACVNRATKSMIYTLSSRFLISFPYVTSWLHYIVHVRSLIISTSLYIIDTYIHSVIFYNSFSNYYLLY